MAVSAFHQAPEPKNTLALEGLAMKWWQPRARMRSNSWLGITTSMISCVSSRVSSSCASGPSACARRRLTRSPVLSSRAASPGLQGSI